MLNLAAAPNGLYEYADGILRPVQPPPTMPTDTCPCPPLPPATNPSFALRQLDTSPLTVEFTVRVQSADGTRYREVKWNETQTPEIARLFEEFTAAEAQLEAQGQ